MKHLNLVYGPRKVYSVSGKACGECQTSCQSACKTSCTVANQKCEKLKK